MRHAAALMGYSPFINPVVLDRHAYRSGSPWHHLVVDGAFDPDLVVPWICQCRIGGGGEAVRRPNRSPRLVCSWLKSLLRHRGLAGRTRDKPAGGWQVRWASLTPRRSCDSRGDDWSQVGARRASVWNCTYAKAPVPRTDGDRALSSVVLPERIARGNGYQWGVLALAVATLLLRAACRSPTWAYRDLSQSILFHPFSEWPFIHTQHKRLLPEPSRIPHHQYALSAPRRPESNDPSRPMRRSWVTRG